MLNITQKLNVIFEDDVDTLKNMIAEENQDTAFSELRSATINSLNLAQLAIINNCPNILAYFLDMCFSTEIEDRDGETLLFYAVGAEKPCANECVDVLLSHRANIHHRNKLYRTPLMVAAYMNNLYAIDRLIECGANVNDYDKSGLSSISFAVYNINRVFRGTYMPDREVILTLLQAGASVEDMYRARCVLSIDDQSKLLPTLVPLSSYSPALLYRSDLSLTMLGPDTESLIDRLLS